MSDQNPYEERLERHTQRTDGVDHKAVMMRALVLVPEIAQYGPDAEIPSRTPSERLAEACGLALAIDLDIVEEMIIKIQKPRPATLLGTGKIDEIAERVEALDAGLVIVDQALTPVQQRNLEKAFAAKVLDRTGLILEIFGRRAQTKEGRLQVDLAHLNYQKGRLVRSWTHLERQRGGAGFLGGPGETQIEADRRQLREKIKRLELDLEQVRRTRTLHRSKRKKVPLPVVAFVGYTNAGKSTLFNRVTGASVQAEDMLFATLDPTLRRVQLPGGTTIILSDTVGFISDLPTHLVAAFRATLEEVEEADLVIHVHDISDPQVLAQSDDVEQVLSDLDIDADDMDRVLNAFNKIDALDEAAREAIKERCAASPNEVAVSAITGEGVDTLLQAVEDRIAGRLKARSLILKPDQYATVAWLYDNAIVRSRADQDDGNIVMDVSLTDASDEELNRRLATG